MPTYSKMTARSERGERDKDPPRRDDSPADRDEAPEWYCPACGGNTWRMSRRGNWVCANCIRQARHRAPEGPPADRPSARTEKTEPAPKADAEEESEYSYSYYEEEAFEEETEEVAPPTAPEPKKPQKASEPPASPQKPKKATEPPASPRRERAAKKPSAPREATEASAKPPSLRQVAQAGVDKARDALVRALQEAKDVEREYRRQFGHEPHGTGASSSGIPRDEDGPSPSAWRRSRRSLSASASVAGGRSSVGGSSGRSRRSPVLLLLPFLPLRPFSLALPVLSLLFIR